MTEEEREGIIKRAVLEQQKIVANRRAGIEGDTEQGDRLTSSDASSDLNLSDTITTSTVSFTLTKDTIRRFKALEKSMREKP